MKTDTIYNESNLDTLQKMEPNSIDVVLTSPFYNTNKKAGKKSTLMNTKVKKGQYAYVRYDVFVDTMSEEQYFDYIISLFNNFDSVLKHNGSILWNVSYGQDGAASMLRLIAAITEKTNFTCADIITWHKKSALPNSCSPNKLTRICEYIFVFCRRAEFYTFHANKEVMSVRKGTKQKMYSSMLNYIEAKNNDEPCPYNKATYSTDLCRQLLSMYAPEGGIVYDPFMGSGTTAAACKQMGLKYIGSEISENQCKWATERLSKIKVEDKSENSN
jgi:site-specific DNA-methyltransferase (adenine-specific)/modification methylase